MKMIKKGFCNSKTFPCVTESSYRSSSRGYGKVIYNSMSNKYRMTI